MTSKQRNVIYLRWSGEIRRESRDFASLENLAARAMADPDVRDDDSLQSMIQGVIQQRRDEIDQNLRYEKVSTEPMPLQAIQRTGSVSVTASPRPAAVTAVANVEPIRATFTRLALALGESLERQDEHESRSAFKQLQAFQEKNPTVIPAVALLDYAQKMEQLRSHLKHLENQIGPLTKQAVAASKCGNEQDLARAMFRLTAIQAAHPTPLGEAGLNEIRRTLLQAADDKREHQATTRKLLERQRAIATEIGKLGTIVRQFHQVAGDGSAVSDTVRETQEAYIQAIQQVHSYDAAWFTSVILEMADLLAEWTLPPTAAESQIDRFLDGVQRELSHIRQKIRELEVRRRSL